MYFPYLRGRQYELIALRELLEKDILGGNIIPIIEPVKLSSTLVKTLGLYRNKNRTVALIVNPNVGEFSDEFREEKNQKLKEAFKEVMSDNAKLLYSRLLVANDNVGDFVEKYNGRMMTICNDKDGIPLYEDSFKGKNSLYNLIPDESGFRRKIREQRVLLDDKFNKRERNADYIKREDEPFSEDHLYYTEDGYVGFSDYSIIGSEYKETGFAPVAVAIHVVYFAEDNALRVRHFVSDSNDDITDPARKFYEAVRKLVEWNSHQKLNTYAMQEFQRLYDNEIYPGLGTVKKLSIMHHLELIGDYLG